MSPPIIRPAGEDDLPSLVRLYLEFHEFHVRGVPERLRTLGNPRGFDSTQLVVDIRGIIAGANSVILVAQAEDEIVGLAEVYVREDEPNPLRVGHRHAHLQSLAVAGTRRRGGYGTRLLAAAERWAQERGATEMRLETWEFPEGPHGFYDKRGYRTLKRTLVRPL